MSVLQQVAALRADLDQVLARVDWMGESFTEACSTTSRMLDDLEAMMSGWQGLRVELEASEVLRSALATLRTSIGELFARCGWPAVALALLPESN